MIPNLKSLKERPKEGVHLEGDLFVSPTAYGNSRSGFLLVDTETKLFSGDMMPNRRPATMVDVFNTVVSSLTGKNMDATFDRGIENKYHEEFSLPSYFCDAHSPWQKGSVENGIGLIRRWFIPKKTDLRDVSEEQYQVYLNIMNHKYRKSLGYRSAYEVSLESGMIQKIPPRERIQKLYNF